MKTQNLFLTAILLLIACCFLPAFSFSQCAWTQKPDFGGTTRTGAVSFSIGSKGYVGTGDDGAFKKDFWEYNPDSNIWTQKADFGGTERRDAVGFSIGTKGFIGTGFLPGFPFYATDFWEYNSESNLWVQKADFAGYGRTYAVGFSIGSKGYIGTGYNNNIWPYYYRDFWEYDTITNGWVQKADFGGGYRYNCTGFSIGTKGYIGTGYNSGTYYKDFWEWTPTNDNWTQKADFGGTARKFAVGFSIGSNGYIATGTDITGNTNDIWAYSISSGAWVKKENFNGTSRNHATGFSIGSKGYIVTGNDGTDKKDLWEYDPLKDVTVNVNITDAGCDSADGSITINAVNGATPYQHSIDSGNTFQMDNNFNNLSADTYYVVVKDTNNCFSPVQTAIVIKPIASICAFNACGWTQIADFGGTTREGAVAFSVGTKGYLGTGRDASNKKDFWEYNPNSDVWTQKADFDGSARSWAVGFSIGNKGYIGTGDDGFYKKDFWEYDPDSNIWSQKADFGGSPRYGAVGFSIGNKGYLGTGDQGYDSQRDFWEYNPSSDTWIQKADLPGAVRVNAVGFSIGSKGYIGTGYEYGYSNSSLKDFWEYDTISEGWTQKTDFAGDGRYSAVGFSIGTKGYIGTGTDNTKDFWEFNQTTNAWTQIADFGGTPRQRAVCFSIGLVAYVGTGSEGWYNTWKKDFWKIKPSQEKGMAINITPTHITCAYYYNGSATVDILFGINPPFSYTWSTGETTQTIGGLGPGLVNVTVTDSTGCSVSESVEIYEPYLLYVCWDPWCFEKYDAHCGHSDGYVAVYPSGGTPPYSFLWNNGDTTYYADSIPGGFYSVTVTDLNGCSTNPGYFIDDLPPGNPNLVISNATCNGTCNGSLAANISGGTPPYSYFWSNGQNSSNDTALCAGSYFVTITDANVCISIDSTIVTEPDPLSVNFTQTGVTCNGGSNGTATANVSGGIAPYSYSWNTFPTQTNSIATNLQALSYLINITDYNNCILLDSVIISQPQPIVVNIAKSNVSCYGGSNGSVTVNASGGTPPLKYSNNGGSIYQSSNLFTNLLAGSYTIVVKDTNNCVMSTAVTITEPTQLTFTTSKINVTCNGGNNGGVTINATGGVTTYQYSNDNGLSYQSSNVFNTLVADTYSVVVKDANNCTATANVILTEPGGISVSTLQTDVTCNGGNDGSIVVLAFGGVNPLQYSKNGGSTFQFSNSFNSLTADTYSVVVKDANSCMTTPLSAIITSPPAITISIIKTNVSCTSGSNGNATATVSGGTGSLSYTWNTLPQQTTATANNLNAGSYTVTITDSLGCAKTSTVTITEPVLLSATTSPANISCNGADNGTITITAAGGTGILQYSTDSGSTYQILNIFNNLSSGTYFVVVMDSNNCTILPQSVILTEPTLLTFTVSQTDINCYGGGDGSITITATGGITPYQYSGNGGTNFQASNVFDSLTAGSYTVVARDNNGCDSTSMVILTEPVVIAFTTSQNNVSCNGAGDGTITVSAIGGSGTLEYSDDGGNTYQFFNTFSSLSNGNYDVMVRDGNNCTTAPVTVTITQPSLLTLALAFMDPTCTLSDATAIATAGGGVSPYSYLWSNGTTDSAAATIGNGTYWITVTDANSCTISDSIAVTEFIYQQDICIVTVDSATKKNLISWEKTAGMGTQGFIIYNEIFTNVYDSIGYVPFDSLSEYIDLTSDPKTKAERYKIATMDSCGNISLLSDSHRTILLTASVGVNNERNLAWNDYEGITPIMQYRIWRGTALNNITLIDSVVYGTNLYADWDTLTGVDSLYYFVEIVHPTGCTSTIKLKTYNASKSNTADMEAPSLPMNIIVTSSNISCNGDNDGTATATITGGEVPYAYTWNDPQSQSDSTATGLIAGTYNVTVTDNNSTTITGSAIITEPAAITVSGLVTDATAPGNDNGAINLAVSGGTPPYVFSWNNGEATEDIDSLPAGIYTVTITDAGNCQTVYADTVKLIVNDNYRIPDTGYLPIATGILVYPNPSFGGKFNLALSLPEKDNYSIEITNTIGQRVFSENLKNFSGNYLKEFDLFEYSGGVYSIHVTGSKVNSVGRVVR